MKLSLPKYLQIRIDRRMILATVFAILLSNLGFLLVSFAARSLPLEPILTSLRLALYRGDILTQTNEFVFLDSARGDEGYGDANILRMAIYRGNSKWMDTIAPRLLPPADGQDRHPAEILHGAVFGTLKLNPESGYYHRYWFGNVAVSAFLLSVFDVRQARLVLMNTSYFLFFLMPLMAALASPRMIVPMGFVGAFGMLFSSLPYHGQTFGYAPAFIWSQMAVLLTLGLWGRLASTRFLVVLNLVLGATAAYFEPMSGASVMAGALLFFVNYLLCSTALPRNEAFARAGLAVGLFFGGFLASVLFKQILVLIFFGWAATFGAFFSQLGLRIGVTGEKITYLQMATKVTANLGYLTFGSPWLRDALCYFSLTALLGGTGLAVANVRVLRERGLAWHERMLDYTAIGITIAVIIAWFVVLPSHNYIHAWITVRLLYIPFCMSALLFYWSIRNLRQDMAPDGIAAVRTSSAIAPSAIEDASSDGPQPVTYSIQHLQETSAILSQIDPAACERVVHQLVAVRERGGRLFVLGVGGSAANASHAVNDLRKIAGIECYAPTDNVAELTARTNDEGWPTVFSAWLRCSHLSGRDCVLVLSVGGGDLKRNVSPNLVQAIRLAKEKGATVLALVGRDGGYAGREADAAIIVPTVNPQNVTPHAEAFQSVLWHLFVSHPALKANQTKWESTAASSARVGHK